MVLGKKSFLDDIYVVWDYMFCPVVGIDASCEFTCGGPRTTLGVIIWALPTILFVLFSESETSPRDVPISTSQVLDYSCTLPCPTFFFNMGPGC